MPSRTLAPVIPLPGRSRTAELPVPGDDPMDGAADEDGPMVVVLAGPCAAVTGRLLSALVGDVPVLNYMPPESYLVLRHGTDEAVRAYVPGHRAPQPFPVPGGAGCVSQRPPRRVEAHAADPLLSRVSLLVAPQLAGTGPASARVALDLVEDGAALVFVTDTRAPIGADGLDLLAAAAQCTDAVFVAVVDDGESARWPVVAGANQSALARVAPSLALTPWHVLGTDGDLTSLRAVLLDWAATLRRGRRPAPADRIRARTGGDSAVSGWQAVLDKEIAVRRQSIEQDLSIELSRIHLRCVRQVVEGGCASLPAAFDRELHGLSVMASRALRTAAERVITAVLAQVLEYEPVPALVTRVSDAVREIVREAGNWDRALLVITTGGVAEVVGHGALAGLAAYQAPEVPEPVLPPVALGLTTACYGMWVDRRSDQPACQHWVQRAVRGMELELQGEIDKRLRDLSEALAALVGDGVEHGILLA